MKRLLLVAFFLFLALGLFSQGQDSTVNWDILNKSLSELMNLKVAVASNTPLSVNESPGVVTVITEDDINRIGARDLKELLSTIPGFDFGAEWDNVIGVGIRGNNATEGKFLILYDGHQLNETNFGTFPFGFHILTDNISRIEIIRGPGSVLYGGTAELAVINIITKGNDFYKSSGHISLNNSFSNGNILGSDVQGYINYKTPKDLYVSLSAYYGRANRSNHSFSSLDSTFIDYRDRSAIFTSNVNASIKYKDINFKFLYNNYTQQNTEASGFVLFENYSAIAYYSYDLSKKISIKPILSYRNIKPWYFYQNGEKNFYNTTNQNFYGRLLFSYKPNKIINIFLGVESTIDVASKSIDTIFYSKQSNNMQFSTAALITETNIKSMFFTLNAGARLEKHSAYGSQFVPRISLIKNYKKFNFKLLWSKAFKAPTIYNIDYNPLIKPEKSTFYEFEFFYQLSKNVFFNLNIFDLKIKNPIIYKPNPTTGFDSYVNFSQTGTRGAEISTTIQIDKISLSGNYSYYMKLSEADVDVYEVDGKPKIHGAFPQHRFNLSARAFVSKYLSINSSIKFYGTRYTYIHSNKIWTEVELVEYSPSLVVDAGLLVRDYLFKGSELYFGVYDITNQRLDYINAYKGYQNPIPSAGRELYLKFGINF